MRVLRGEEFTNYETIEDHRFRIMEKMHAKSLAELIGMVSASFNLDES